ncbi:hypothetical protein BDZ88DRAFT_34698 [Geranomyces variabilis]|nr:hypothetical protein BDZ88DRAFT_34698 [Geranomyces variabilis]
MVSNERRGVPISWGKHLVGILVDLDVSIRENDGHIVVDIEIRITAIFVLARDEDLCSCLENGPSERRYGTVEDSTAPAVATEAPYWPHIIDKTIAHEMLGHRVSTPPALDHGDVVWVGNVGGVVNACLRRPPPQEHPAGDRRVKRFAVVDRTLKALWQTPCQEFCGKHGIVRLLRGHYSFQSRCWLGYDGRQRRCKSSASAAYRLPDMTEGISALAMELGGHPECERSPKPHDECGLKTFGTRRAGLEAVHVCSTDGLGLEEVLCRANHLLQRQLAPLHQFHECSQLPVTACTRGLRMFVWQRTLRNLTRLGMVE